MLLLRVRNERKADTSPTTERNTEGETQPPQAIANGIQTQLRMDWYPEPNLCGSNRPRASNRQESNQKFYCSIFFEITKM
jgi:hypothetical protein